MFAAISLQSCQQAASLESPTSAESPKAAARATIPTTGLGSITPWTLSDYETITYYLDGAYSTNASYRASAVEAFKEWSVVFQDYYHHVRFQETTDRDFANIRVAYGSTMSGGCVEGTRVRYCDLLLSNPGQLLKGIGQIMGIPASTVSGDVMNSSTLQSIFTDNDITQVYYKYNINNIGTAPMFEIPYYNATGTEVVIGWASLRSRTVPGPVYVKKNLYDRKLVAGLVAAGRDPEWNYEAGVSILPYVKSGIYTYVSYWNYNQFNYSGLHASGLSGGDPAPGVLGYSGCADYSVTPSNNNYSSSYHLFGFNPEQVWLGGYYSVSASAPIFPAGATVPVYFYKDVTTNRFRVSTTQPTTNATCVRLGGYGLAVN